jgi:phage tail sheath protein FI
LPDTVSLHSGADGHPTTPSAFLLGYDLFKDSEEIDISMILGGPHGGTVSKYIVESIAEKRKDCVAFISPLKANVNVEAETLSQKTDNVKAYRLTEKSDAGINSLSSSYGVMDSGWKYQYDKFNDKYRWVPLNGDIAGLCARTDQSRDAWWSPAGFNRGHIKNVARLAWNPQKAHRDELYKNGINPVVTIRGQGTVLFGDKTLQAKPSAFDRINVRRLFIVLEKAIATAAKFTLFEFNDEFTRSQFTNMVEPFLRDVQGRRGIYDFKVVCDNTNNTPEVVDRNEFVGDIYIKPARSINFIQLNFVAVRTGVSFEEVVGKF